MAWQTKQLEDICIFQRGLTYSKKDEVEFSDNIVLRANNIDLKTHQLDLSELKYINTKVKVDESKKVKKGSMIMCTASGSKSHLGKVAIIDRDYDYAFGGFMAQLTPNKDIDSKFFFYILTSDVFNKHLEKISSGTNINNLKFSDISAFQIQLPSLEEQKRIVKKLDEVFEKVVKAKEAAEKNLRNAKDLFESYLQSVFANPEEDWEKKKLGDVCDLISGQHIMSSDYNIDSKGIGYLTGPSDFGVFSPIITKWTEYPKVTAKKGDILITVKGSGIGKINLLDTDEVAISRQLMAIRSKGVSSQYIYAFLSLQYGFFQSLGNGAAIPGISRNNVLNLICPIPSLSEQKMIVKKIGTLSVETKKLEKIYQQKLTDLEELKKLVLSKAFNAEL